MTADLVPVDSGGTDGRDGWQEGDWEALLLAIKFGQCTPFVGAGASVGTLPLGGELAERWAKRDQYPFGDVRNLPRVAQYTAVTRGANLPRLRVKEEFTGKGPPNFDAPGEIHGVVAQLPLAVYITTNYDNFMAEALTKAGRQPVSEICPWRTATKRRAVTDEPPTPFPKPSIASP